MTAVFWALTACCALAGATAPAAARRLTRDTCPCGGEHQ